MKNDDEETGQVPKSIVLSAPHPDMPTHELGGWLYEAIVAIVQAVAAYHPEMTLRVVLEALRGVMLLYVRLLASYNPQPTGEQAVGRWLDEFHQDLKAVAINPTQPYISCRAEMTKTKH